MSNLLVVLGDSPEVMVKKGEVKPGYYNPLGLFKEVHFFVCEDIADGWYNTQFEKAAGKAKCFFYFIGKAGKPNTLVVAQRVALRIKPDLIEARNPHWHGSLAQYLSKSLAVPFVLYLHANFDDIRNVAFKQGRFKEYLKLKAYEQLFERFVISSADLVIGVYPTIEPYAKAKGAKLFEVVYNKVYPEPFRKAKPHKFVYPDGVERPTVLCVSRFIEEKNPLPVIEALPLIPSVGLCLIGRGKLLEKGKVLASSLGVSNRVIFIDAVPNVELPSYYKGATMLVQPLSIKGIPIPVLEAHMAGIPVLCGRSIEVIDHTTICLSRKSKDIADDISWVFENMDSSVARFVALGSVLMKNLDGLILEKREKNLLADLMVQP